MIKVVLRVLIWPAAFIWFGISLVSVWVFIRDLDLSMGAILSLVFAILGLLSLLVMSVSALKYPNISLLHIVISQLGCAVLGFVMYQGLFNQPMMVLSGLSLLLACSVLSIDFILTRLN
ncbi:hypothetical protein HG263_02505 [Pseudoalteromonas sp. JBTF-M23]|uniref:Uncharacterized protein n=1 Tax=Pseudoalteromonas caenipelagi TaxID=2726988 RepID=A0A849VCA5_9GAMM|nr:hypothetical protein [Pseudoalteromonas caenipelagi]NOU49417.1 hypothetical protein [Pseudoalteromonas caenipelagi]